MRVPGSAGVREGRGCLEPPPRSSGLAPQPQRPACARPRAALPHEHAPARERRAPASPALRRRRARAGAQESEREAGAPDGAGARERRSRLRSSAHEDPPLPRPPLLPRAGSARPKPRACARVRRPGPSGGGPVDSIESVARSRINPFLARPFTGPVRFRACASRRRAFPPARTAHAREGGVPAAGKRGPGVRKGPGPSARRARGRGGGRPPARRGGPEEARSRRALGHQPVPGCAGGRQRCAANGASHGPGQGRAGGPGAVGAAQASERAPAAAGRRRRPRARARRASAAEFMAAPARTAAVHRGGGGGGDGPEPGAERGPPGAAPPSRGPRRAAPSCLPRRGPGPPRSHSRVRPRSSEAGRAPPPPPAAGGRGRARREPAGECAGRELRARGARRGAAEPGRTPAPAPARRRRRRGPSRFGSERRPPACAGLRL
uniref:collagen alpha-1(I) chain-like n=1 Tax=Odobenus rosmarus divergens TaxID=9708 RepID=UPI00063C9DC2|nr:PREDICTED: collagen alpha-1(I) chain-like [Odobenus rosmarus divergens]